MTKLVDVFDLEPQYKKPNGVYVQEIDRTDLPLGFEPVVRHLVTLPPSTIAGNHRHPRIEAFIGIGDDLEFFWMDADNTLKSIAMNPNGELKLIIVSPNTPHAVRNNSHALAVLLEYANETQDISKVTPDIIVE